MVVDLRIECQPGAEVFLEQCFKAGLEEVALPGEQRCDHVGLDIDSQHRDPRLGQRSRQRQADKPRP